MSIKKEEIKTQEEDEEVEIDEEEEEQEEEEETKMEEDVEFNQNAVWIQQLFAAPGFSKWRAEKALEEGKDEKVITNILVDYNMKIMKCNDVADFIMSKCNPKDALKKKKDVKKNEALDKLMKKANQKFHSVVGSSKSKENTKPKKN